MASGQEQTGVLLNRDGLRLFYREWLVSQPRGTVVICHGLGEHGGRYAHLAARLNALGMSVMAPDHRGHGRSEGARGALARPDDLLDDLKLALDDYASRTASVPFLFGHSMGGLLAARFAERGESSVRGLMLSSPAFAFTLSIAQRALLAIACRIAPSLAAANGLEVAAISHDAAVVAAYRADALVHGVATPRLVRFMQVHGLLAVRDAGRLRVPVLLQIAGADRLVEPSASKTFFEALAPGVGTMHWYHDAYHEIYNESAEQRARVFADLSAWLGPRLV
jgi:alpha-beta hydrolase superfamily lysophospholipase